MRKNKKANKTSKMLLLIAVIFFIFLLFFAPIVKFAAIAMFDLSTGARLGMGKLKIGLNNAYVSDLRITDKNKKNILSVDNIKISYSVFNFLKGKNFADKVFIKKPVLNLKRLSAEKWNIAFFLKKKNITTASKPKTETALHIYKGEITVSGGGIIIEDNVVAQKTIKIDLLGFNYDYFNKGKTISGILRAEDSARIKINGIIKNQRLYTQLNAENINIVHYINFLLPNRRDFLFTNGVADVEVDFITGIKRGFTDYQGYILLDRGAFYSGMWPYGFSNLNGKIAILNNCLFSKTLDGNFGAVPVKVSGMLNDFSWPTLDIKIDAPPFDLNLIEKFWSKDFKVKIDGMASALVKIKSKADRSIVEAVIEAPSVYFADGASKGEYIKNILMDFDFYDNTFFINNFSAGLGGGALTAKGEYILEKAPEILLSVKADSINIDRSLKSSAGEIKVKADTNFDFYIAGNIKSPVFIGDMKLNNINIGKNNMGSASADFIYNENLFYLKNATVFQDNKNTASACGIVDFKNSLINLDVLTKNFKFSAQSVKDSSDISGMVTLGAEIRGKINNPNILAVVRSSSVNFNDMPAENVNLEFLSGPTGMIVNKGFAKIYSSDVIFGYLFDKAGTGYSAYFSGDNLDFKKFNKAVLGNKFNVFDKVVSVDIYLSGDKNKGYFYEAGLTSGKQTINMSGFNDFLIEGNGGVSILRASGIDLKSFNIPTLPPGFMAGKIDLDSMLVFKGKEVGAFGNFKLKNGTIASMPVTSGYYDANISKNKIDFEKLTFMSKSVFLTLKGFADKAGVSLKYGIVNRNLYSVDKIFDIFAKNKIKDINGKEIKFEFASIGVIKYLKSNLYVDGKLMIPNGLISNELFNLSSKFKYSEDTLTLKPLVFRQDDAKVTLDGNMDFSGKKNIHLNIITDKLNINKILKVTALAGQDIAGELSSNFLITGKTYSPNISGNADIFNLKLMGNMFKKLGLSLTSDANQFIFSDLNLTVNRGEIYGLGKINKKGDMEFNFYSDNFPIEEMPWLGKAGNLSGNGKVNIKIFGTKNNPNLIAKLEYENITINDKKFSNAVGNMSFGNNKLNFAPLYMEEGQNNNQMAKNNLNKKTGKYSVEGDIDFSQKDLLANLNFIVSNGSLSSFLALLNVETKERLEGAIDLSLFLNGALSNPSVALKGTLKDGLIGQGEVNLLTADISYKDKALTVNDFNIKQNKGSLGISGELKEKDSDIEFMTDNFDVSVISPFIPKGHSVSGFLSAYLNIKNSITAPDISSKFKLSKGKIDNFEFDEFNGKVEGSKGLVYFKDWKILKGKHVIAGEGKIPVVMKKGELYSAAPLEFTMKFSENDLSLLNIFGEFIDSSSGQFNGEVKVAGPLYDIKMSGAAAIKKAEAKIKDIQTPLENINAKISFVENKLHFDNFEAELGGGKIKVTGDIAFDKLKPSSYNLQLKADNVKMDSLKYYSGNLEGDISFYGDYARRSLGGVVKASGGNLNLQELYKLSSYALDGKSAGIGKQEFNVPLAYNMNFILDKVWLNNQSSVLKTYFRSTGLLEVRGQDKPTLKGQINFSQGNIIIYNTSFKVTDGMAFFDGTENWMPKIDLEARTKVKDIDIFVEITGSIDRPISSFSSDPPLRESEIVSLLAAKIIPSALPFGAGSVVSQYMYSAIQASFLEPLMQALGQNIFMGDVGFEYGQSGMLSLRVAKAIDKDEKFYVTFSRTYDLSNMQINTWGIEYKLQNRTVLLLENDNYGNYYYGVKARWQY